MARNIKIEIIGDARSLARAFAQSGAGAAQFESKIEKASQGLQSAGKKLTVGLTVPLLGLATLGVKAASDLGEQINKTSVVFGKSGKDIQAWSETTAKSLGISQRAALEAAGTFGNMLVPMGFAREEAAKMSTRMVELAADMASFNNADPTQVLEALRSGLAGETEPLRQFGVFLNEARIKQEALALGLWDGKGALDASAKASATYAIILKDTKDAQGDFANTSDSLANKTRIVKAELENAAASIGAALLPAVQKAAGFVQTLVEKFQALGPEGQKMVLLGGGIVAGLGPALTVLGNITKAVKGVGAAFALLSANPVILVGAAVVALGVGLSLLANKLDDAKSAFNRAKDAATSYKSALDTLKGSTLSQSQAELNLRQAQLSRSQAVAALNAYVTSGKPINDNYRAAVLAVEQAELSEKQASLALAQATKNLSAAKVDAKAKTEAASAAISRFEERAHTAAGAAELLKVGVRFAAGELQGLNNQANRSNILNAYQRALNAISGAAGGTSTALGSAAAQASNLAGAIRNIPTSWSTTVTTFFRTVGSAFRFQHGGVSPGGMALVGEAGPELVGLPRGARVFSNPQSRRMMGGSGGGPGGGVTVQVFVQGSVMSERDLAHTIRDTLLQGAGSVNPSLWGARA